MQRGQFSAGQCYEVFEQMGISYGPAHRAIAALHAGDAEVLARLSLPSCGTQFVLHPGLLDSAIQASLGLLLDSQGMLAEVTPMLPFALDRVDVLAPCGAEMWALIVPATDTGADSALQKLALQKLDITLCDETGRVCVRLTGFSSRKIGDGVKTVVAERKINPSEVPQTAPQTAPQTGALQDQVQAALLQLVSSLIKVKPEDIDLDSELSEYGFDSISLTELANKLNQEYGLELMPTLFFEHGTVSSLATYLVEAHQALFARRFGSPASAAVAMPQPQIAVTETALQAPVTRRSRFGPASAVTSAVTAAVPEAIAIVGISGCMPMADDLDAFWTNLVEGRDCISEIPANRWDWQAMFGDPDQEANKSNVKWGGFIDGVDQFDPQFFGITPREAQVMDPQQRLLMTYVWKALEDAGYAAQGLSGSRTALFVGTCSSGYGSLLAQSPQAQEAYTSTALVSSIGPNRMSYFLNLHGPSEPIETACSSSLVAVNRGVAVLRDGSCEMAIVGGVNTIVTPDAHISFNKAGMLSQDGRCKTFSQHANGYVRGEGVGMLVLKRLSDAERDGDHIYGLIRGGAENHGGRASSLTAPNPLAQAELLKDAYTRAGIDPRTISYIEAHGTGTKLGDPVEITGLKHGFGDLHPHAGAAYCGLGSVKSNIGHLELAAGVAGVIKVLLQMKHKTLVKSLHSTPLNPYFDLSDSPFYVVQETGPWQAQTDAQGRALPLRAGVSSFGFGGVNAHVVLEEYVAAAAMVPAVVQGPSLIVLSARNEDRLRETAANLLAYLQQHEQTDLTALAYTLQLGRDAMEERLGWAVSSLAELVDKLRGFVADGALGSGVRGQVKRNKEAVSVLSADEDTSALLDAWLAKGRYGRVLEIWSKGLNVSWERLYGAVKPQRLSLPTYPFAKERHWVDTLAQPVVAPAASAAPATPVVPGVVAPVGEAVFEQVATRVAALSGLDANALKRDMQWHELGLDSVFLLQLIATLIRDFPQLDRKKDGDVLLRCTTVGDMVSHIEQAHGASMTPVATAMLYAFTPPARHGTELTLRPAKNNPQNQLCDELRIEASDPVSLSARVVVDETHPFFFDHPLDHVSGMHLGAAMSEAVKAAHAHRYHLHADTVLFVSTIELNFLEVCSKEPDAIVHVTAAASPGFYDASVSQEGRLMVRAHFAVHGMTPHPSGGSKLPPGVRPASQTVLNKLDGANVLLSEALGTVEKPGCYLLPQTGASFFTDFPQQMIDIVVLAEAARQSLRMFSAHYPEAEHASDAATLPETMHSVDLLKTLKLQMERPLFWDEAVYLELSLYEKLEIGSATLLQIEGIFMVEGREAGRFSTNAMSLSAALHEEWGQRAGLV
ncbi:beta-ketoacyl synthase N-terminal-like domain-containing protein [Massilia sp. DJPM01]|uniref:beta-ketoacyl synthase N-terminal-like domain-containing protein n=1 Tax=Massilia sp. DJPM01 TaxID=3024404 RepID=UPI0035A2F30A